MQTSIVAKIRHIIYASMDSRNFLSKKENNTKTKKWSFLQRFYLDNVFFLREKNLSSFLLDVDGFSRVFLLKIFDFRSEPGEFLVFVLSTVSLAHRGRKTKFFSRDVPN